MFAASACYQRPDMNLFLEAHKFILKSIGRCHPDEDTAVGSSNNGRIRCVRQRQKILNRKIMNKD